jgi:hypothetical protein
VCKGERTGFEENFSPTSTCLKGLDRENFTFFLTVMFRRVFYDAVRSSDYIPLNGRSNEERGAEKYLEASDFKLNEGVFSIYLGGLRKTTKNIIGIAGVLAAIRTIHLQDAF